MFAKSRLTHSTIAATTKHGILCFLFVFILLFLIPKLAAADTAVGGTISTDTTWSVTGNPYIVTSNITVIGTDGTDGITTLTIEPGVTVKFNSSRYMTIGASSGDPGALIAQGTSENPILFTSNQATPAPGDWYYIRFYNTTDDATTVMEHCVVEYGGYSGGMLYAYQASPTFRNVTVQNSNSYGGYFYTSEPTIEDCTFSGNQNYDLYYTGTVGGTLTGSTINSGIYLLATGMVSFSGNTINQNNAIPIKTYANQVGAISGSTFNNVDASSYLEVSGGTIANDATWTASIAYAVTNNIVVKGTDGADSITTLTLQPGAVVKVGQNKYVDIGASSGDPGALIAQGTSENPILFTSNKATPAPGDWYSIRFYNTADDATTVMEHCVVEYGGYNSGMLYAYQASPTFRNVTVQNSKIYGAYFYTSEPTIEDCTFSGNQNYDLYYTGTVGGTLTGSTINSGIYLLATGTVTFSDNTINQNNSYPIKAYADNVGPISASTFNNVDASSYLEVSGGTIANDASWTAAIAYAVTNNMTVKGTDGADSITTLTLQPGAVLKVGRNKYLNIGASSGDPGALIAQGTSQKPILFTSNQASPAPGDWYYIRFYTTCDDATTIMEHCVVEYGGYSSGGIYLYQASPRIQNTTIRYSNTAGIYAYGSGTGSASINCNTFSGNQNGIYWAASAPHEMHGNNFNGNTNYGLYYTGSVALDAEDNWWADSDGPNQTGDRYYGNVDADPWSEQENDCTGSVENQPPNEPCNPTPSDAAVRISTENGVVLSWTGGDPNPLDSVSYDLYLGTSSTNRQLVAAELNQTTYTLDPANPGVTYYWQIVSKDDHGAETQGPIWHFTTDGDPPDLIVSAVATDPAGNLQSGQSVAFIADIQNIGSGPLVDPFTVEVLVDSVSIGTIAVDQILLSNEAVQINQAWTYNGGDPTIAVVADSLGAVTESDESNNTFSAVLSEVADNSAPILASTSPVDSDHLQSIQQITVTLIDTLGTVDDSAVIASFAVTDHSQQTIAGTVTEFEDVFTFVPGSLPLPDEIYQVGLTAADTYGNTQNYSFSFTIDTQPPGKPIITGGTVDSGTIQPRPVQNVSSQFIVELTGTREVGTSVWINGSQAVDMGDSDWIDQITLMSGDNVLGIWLQDAAGNQSESEWVDIEMQTGSGTTYEYNGAGRIKRVDVQ
jgi:hypothetical protein